MYSKALKTSGGVLNGATQLIYSLVNWYGNLYIEFYFIFKKEMAFEKTVFLVICFSIQNEYYFMVNNNFINNRCQTIIRNKQDLCYNLKPYIK